MSLAWFTVVKLVVFFKKANYRNLWLTVFVGLAKSTLLRFIIVINLILCFHYNAEIELGS